MTQRLHGVEARGAPGGDGREEQRAEDRAADPSLGRAFIAAAARLLAPQGGLWLVANRHLPYEAALAEAFGEVQEIAGDASFKVIEARRPISAKRKGATKGGFKNGPKNGRSAVRRRR